MTIVVRAIAFVGYLAYGWAALLRIGALDSSTRMIAGCLGLAALWLLARRKPLTVTLILLGALPLFGNHPGGRYMELINLPLAASTAGLTVAARRARLDPPNASVWWIAGLYLLTAVLAMIPTLPGLALRAAEINDAPLLIAASLTAAEDDPLYSVSSIALVALALAWAYALSWAGAAARWARHIAWVLAIVLLAVTAIGICDYVGVTSLGPRYIRHVDARAFHLVGLQSIFWHPAWFAWYFVVVFGLALGLSAIECGPRRWMLGGGLVIAYFSFLLNPQRGGLIAVHVILGFASWEWIRRSREPRRSARYVAAVAVLILAMVAAAYILPPGRAALADGNLLSVQRAVNNAVALVWPAPNGSERPSERYRLWRTALAMWADAPLLGIGEGAFAWRYREYVPAGSALDTPSYGDAHSVWFQMLATRGLAGTAIFACLVFALARDLTIRWRSSDAAADLTGPFLALCAFLTYSLVSALFYLQPMQILFWLIVAIAAKPSSRPIAKRGTLKALGAMAVIAIVVQLVEGRQRWGATASKLSRQPRGFYSTDVGPFGAPVRWSSASGVLCLKPNAARLLMRFAIIDPRVSALPRIITLQANGREVDRFVIATTEVITRSIALPPTDAVLEDAVPFGECTVASRRLVVSVNRTWSPLDTGFGADPRRLGVLVFEPTYLEVAPGLDANRLLFRFAVEAAIP